MNVSDFINGLQDGGYWDEWCDHCQEETPHSSGDETCDDCGRENDDE